MRDDETHGDQADPVTDTYQERVLRNEGRLLGLEQLVKETRAADRQLIEQRSDSLAQELERRAESLLELVTARADAVLVLSQTERASDLREFRDALSMHIGQVDERWAGDQKAMRLAVDSVAALFNEKIEALEERRIAATDAVATMVEQWRDSDREARVLLTVEINRRLDALNHDSERRQEFQNHAVTRELFASDKAAQTERETVLREQIIALDRVMLGMTPSTVSEKAHADIWTRSEAAISASAKVLDTRVNVIDEKINELKTYRDTQAGRSTGYSAFVGWGVAATAVITTIIILANFFITAP
jgi:hypothetical protein